MKKLLLILLLLPITAQAQVRYGAGDTAGGSVSNLPSDNTHNWAWKITTGAIGGVSDSLKIRMVASSSHSSGHMKFGLYSDSGDDPNILIDSTATIFYDSLQGYQNEVWGQYKFLMNSTLSGNTTYWIAIWTIDLNAGGIGFIRDGSVAGNGDSVKLDADNACCQTPWTPPQGYWYPGRGLAEVRWQEAGVTAPDTLASCYIDSLHSDYSGNADSMRFRTVTKSETGNDSVIVCYSTSAQPDSSSGSNRVRVAYAASHTDSLYATPSITETGTLYASFWVWDAANGWSLRRERSRVFTAGDEYAPDNYKAFSIKAILSVNPDTIRFQVGALPDSSDADSAMVRYGTSIPTATGGTQLYRGVKYTASNYYNYLMFFTEPGWCYFTLFAMDEVGNCSTGLPDSIYVPRTGASVIVLRGGGFLQGP